jgi:RNA polymerase sigma-70 factor (ECF subfamily)
VVTLAESRSLPQGLRQASALPLDALRALDDAAWQALYTDYFAKLRGFAYARTGDLTLAEDIAAECFAAAVKGIGSYRDTGAPIGAWLYRIARNITADHLSRRRKRPSVTLDDIEVESPAETARLEAHADLARDIARLTREQQELIALRFFGDCSLEETARALEKSIGAVKVLQHRALASLRRQMTARGEGR